LIPSYAPPMVTYDNGAMISPTRALVGAFINGTFHLTIWETYQKGNHNPSLCWIIDQQFLWCWWHNHKQARSHSAHVLSTTAATITSSIDEGLTMLMTMMPELAKQETQKCIAFIIYSDSNSSKSWHCQLEQCLQYHMHSLPHNTNVTNRTLYEGCMFALSWKVSCDANGFFGF